MDIIKIYIHNHERRVLDHYNYFFQVLKRKKTTVAKIQIAQKKIVKIKYENTLLI